MKLTKVTIVILALCIASFGTTKIRLHNTPSAVAGYKAMDLSLGPNGNAVVTSVTTTTAAGNDIQWTNSGGGSTLAWITPPLSSTTTISGTITFNFYAKESATSVNATIRPTLILYHGGAETTTITNCGFATELTASIAAKNWSTASGGWTACSVTSTAIAAGDRIVLKAYVNGCTTTCTVAGSGMAAGSVTVDYDGPTDAADGSSWVQLNETETFSADTGSNALLVACYNRAGGTLTVTDNKGNTWNNGPKNVGTNLTVYSFYTLNPASGTQEIYINPTSTVAGWLCSGYEVTHIASASALEVSSGAHSTSGTTMTSGSMTPLTSGDFLWQWGVEDGVWGSDANTTSWSTATQGTCAWALVTADIWQVAGSQWCVQGTVAAINPTMTMSLSAHSTSVAMALLASGGTPVVTQWHSTSQTSGTFTVTSGAGNYFYLRLPNATPAPTSGIRVVGVQDTDSGAFGTCSGGSPCTATIQMPTQGNLFNISYEGTPTMSLSAVSSTPSNTWVLPAGCLVQTANGAQNVYAENATSSNTQTFSVTEAVYGGAETIKIYDIAGAPTSAFDNCVTDHSTGTVTNHTDITPSSITPSTANGLVIAVIGVQGGTVWSLTSPATNQNFVTTTFAGELGNNVPTDRNNGFAQYNNPSTSAVSFTWHAGDTSNWDGWATSQIAFKAPAGVTQGPGIRHK